MVSGPRRQEYIATDQRIGLANRVEAPFDAIGKIPSLANRLGRSAATKNAAPTAIGNGVEFDSLDRLIEWQGSVVPRLLQPTRPQEVRHA